MSEQPQSESPVEASESQGEDADQKQYEKRVEAQIQEWEQKIERLRERLRKAQADLKEGIGKESKKYESELESLRVKRDAAKQVLQELKKKGGDLWGNFQEDLSEALAGAGDGLHRMAERLRKKGD